MVGGPAPNVRPTETPADKAIAFARAQLGKPYRYGFTGPDYYDCSGLVQAAYRSAGISLPRTSEAMLTVGSAVKESDLLPGDLVFPDSGHVQIYVGNRTVIEAPYSGSVVRQGSMWGFFAGRRVTTPGSSIFDVITDPIKSVVTSGYDAIVNGVVSQLEAIPGVKQVETLGTVLQKLSDKKLWMRIGIAAMGSTMITIGFIYLVRKPVVRIGEAVATDGGSELVRNRKVQNGAAGL